MLAKQPAHYKTIRQWRMLFIYNIYRIICVGVLMLVLLLDNRINSAYYFFALSLYFLYSVGCLYLWRIRAFTVEQQVLWSGTMDIIWMSLLIHEMGYMQAGLGVLLNATIAVLSILMPGQLAIYFAAIATCMLLGSSALDYANGVQDSVTVFFFSGIYGAGFFATALTAWYLARWVRLSEHLVHVSGKELASMQRINEYIVERLHYGVIYVDLDANIKVINTSARQFFNREANPTGLALSSLSAPLYQKYVQFLAKRKPDQQVAQANLDTPALQVRFFSDSMAEKTPVLLLIDNMVDIAQQAQQLKLASLGRFSASIAHELRNPLGAISHAAQLMGEETPLLKEDARLKQIIMTNCNRMNNVIKNVLQLSRRDPSKPQRIKLAHFLTQFKRDFCMFHTCEMNLVIPASLKKTVVFDKSQLEQVLVILCENALDHGRDKNGDVFITLIVKYRQHRMALWVCDTGIGIANTIRHDVFEPFFSTRPASTGMGLFIAKDLCEMNQASLSLEDSKQGCCAVILFNEQKEIKV